MVLKSSTESAHPNAIIQAQAQNYTVCSDKGHSHPHGRFVSHTGDLKHFKLTDRKDTVRSRVGKENSSRQCLEICNSSLFLKKILFIYTNLVDFKGNRRSGAAGGSYKVIRNNFTDNMKL